MGTPFFILFQHLEEITMDSYLVFLDILLGLYGVWLFLLLCFNSKTRHYQHDGHEIEVKAGWVQHYIKIDGIIADELKAAFTLRQINLQAQRENLIVEVKIGNGFLGNTIHTKINGMLV
ncbi:MAG: hypothetical protein FWD58_01115 [Firmicutes bacterium]|nr:hypothetical protein [Bacillota bacterium]